jgi:uncharacterized membrane protein
MSSFPAYVCLASGQKITPHNSATLESLRPGVQAMILEDYPAAKPDDRIADNVLTKYRRKYIESILAEERGEVSSLEEAVINAVSRQDTMSRAPEQQQADHPLTFGDRIADRVASFGGSWKFLISFAVCMMIWIGFNQWKHDAFDPFPFILLNLILSCLASVQAPVIMMSQNRKEARDRLAAEHDYQINLKAELEIRHLHEKIDHLMGKQWERLAAIQQMQIELLENRLAMTGEKEEKA